MGKYINRSVLAALAMASVGLSTSAHADTSLLNASDKAQLAAWLGQGQIKLTSIYTKGAGDTSANFHAAVDGKGRTFAVMEAHNASGQTWLVGGYNPQSWSVKGDYNVTVPQADRTAFLFNLTSGVMHLQTPKNYALDSVGSYQTYNDIHYGPTFGYGNDLYVGADLTHGESLMYSYVDDTGSNAYTSLLDGSHYVRANVTYGAMQVYSITAVPEPGSAAMLLAGLAGIALVRRRRRA
ncbi:MULTISPECIES: PEP_CTERM-anchored TLD domain-containing protein [unclassified Duganella]|uniref:PEP_CTERM-anchored TLD domain-containing protein n=1 Tax=unclassified Duganella TaxID=2636909 RepID=UPI000E34BF9F|nr:MULTISPECIES: PEP_CTERM-anchored TLD domain-containing protein [unclassified Duganella]RFP09605.1 PEP-CTERM sorting domain-containing protein [Duganella sp. BJB475]RFP27725.1 PEP-CTERM sorting domain-containing protein [Duganella sp. BJB476]